MFIESCNVVSLLTTNHKHILIHSARINVILSFHFDKLNTGFTCDNIKCSFSI